MIASRNTFPCSQCGGTATSVAGREYLQCEYCRSLVFTADNPMTVDRITPVDGEMEADCPVCEKELRTGKIEDRPVLYCSGCFGLLLKNEDFGSVVRVRRARRAGVEAEPVKPLDMAAYERHLRCPSCRSRMEVHPYYGPGNIVMDSCHRCQFIWLDHGELRTLERSEGGREPEPLPLHVNSDGEVTIIPPPTVGATPAQHYRPESPLEAIASLLFGG